MSLIPYIATGQLEWYQEAFHIPGDWTTRGLAIFLGGANLRGPQPVALVLTKSLLFLCGAQGPMWSLPLGSVIGAQTHKFEGLAIPINTKSGTNYMIPSNPIGLQVSYNATPVYQGVLDVFTLTPQAASGWVYAIQSAMIGIFEANNLGGLEFQG
jgi:hypothetical protein